MWVVEDMKQAMAILLGVTSFMVVLIGVPIAAPSAEGDWLTAMMNAVRVEQTNEAPFWGTYEPYIAQLEVVRAYYQIGDVAAVYAAMNHFMDMLEERVNGIPEVSADWLFDYCYAVTPGKYHDISRHIEKFRRHQFGGPIRPVG